MSKRDVAFLFFLGTYIYIYIYIYIYVRERERENMRSAYIEKK